MMKCCLYAVLCLGVVCGHHAYAGPVTLEGLFLASSPPNGAYQSIAYDEANGTVFAGQFSIVTEYSKAGVQLNSFGVIPFLSSNYDLDFSSEEFSLLGNVVREGDLLVFEGSTNLSVWAASSTDGTPLTPIVPFPTAALPSGGLIVGGAYSALRDSLFVVGSNETIQEISPTNTLVENSFSVNPPGQPIIDIASTQGDLDVSSVTGNLYVVGGSQPIVRVLSPTGAFIEDIDISAFIGTPGGISGIALDEINGEAYVVSRSSSLIYRLGGAFPSVIPEPSTITSILAGMLVWIGGRQRRQRRF